jgi:hypothetical protein
VLEADDVLGLYKFRVSRTIKRVKQVTTVQKWEHEFKAMDLLLDYWAREETAEIWDSNYDNNKKCNMPGATYATTEEIRESGRSEGDLSSPLSPLSPLPDQILWLDETALEESSLSVADESMVDKSVVDESVVAESVADESAGNGSVDAAAEVEEGKETVLAIRSMLL